MTEQSLLDMAIGERLPSNMTAEYAYLRVPGGWIYEYRKRDEGSVMFRVAPKMHVVMAVFIPEPLPTLSMDHGVFEEMFNKAFKEHMAKYLKKDI